MDDLSALADDDLIDTLRNRAAAAERVREGRLELYRRFGRRLLAFVAGRAAPQDREDLAQAVWLLAWTRLEQYQGGNFLAWLMTLARNLVIDWGRKKRPQLTSDLERPGGDTPLDEVLRSEREQRLRHCVQHLPDEEREVVLARLGGPEPDLPAQRAYKLFFQAKQRLRSCMERDQP